MIIANAGCFRNPVPKNEGLYTPISPNCHRLVCPSSNLHIPKIRHPFVGSNIKMVEFYGGVTEYLTIDNLKAGVIKAHIYDPQLNNAYAEFAKHYGTFINLCIPGHAKGKAKVERQVQEVRELFRRLKEVHPTYTLKELNRAAGRWCCHEYGMKTHGTTGLKPTENFRLNPATFQKSMRRL